MGNHRRFGIIRLLAQATLHCGVQIADARKIGASAAGGHLYRLQEGGMVAKR